MINGGAFWEVKKRIERKKEVKSVAIENKEGKRECNTEKIKGVYKEFYETLLKSKEAENEEEREQERIINERYRKIEEKSRHQEPIRITMTDVKNTIKSLKKGKAGDEFGWKNEILIHGGEMIQEGIMMMFNEVNEKELIPE